MRYTFKQVCTHILGVTIDFTTKLEIFVAHQGAKLSYGQHPLGKELYCQSTSILFENGFNPIEIQVQKWEDIPCFFAVKAKESALPFDIFAASFYLLTRYEEYFPHVKDEHGRFVASESLAYKHGFLQQPVVDIWALKFKQILRVKFPELVFKSKRYEVLPVVSVSQVYAYKEKGVLRTLGGLARDISKFQMRHLSTRLKVILGFKKDPYDTFDFILKFQKTMRKKIVFLFGLGDYSENEKSISSNRVHHRALIKSVADYSTVGLRVSYEAVGDTQLLKKEKLRIEGITLRPLQHTQCSHYKINIPETYRNLVEMEVKEDFSMGYPENAGFRAGTCSPFLFYDLEYEVQTPLWVYSFCFTNAAFRAIEDLSVAQVRIEELMTRVGKVGGVFIPIFSNGLFVATRRGLFWRSVFEFIWKSNV